MVAQELKAHYTTWRYRGRDFTHHDVAYLRQFIAARPALSRRALSLELCEAWQWKQPNGAPRDSVCRGLLLLLDRAGQIALPPARRGPARQNKAHRERPEPLVPDTRPVRGPLRDLGPLRIEQVRRTGHEAVFNSLIEQYHYLGYEQPVGEHVKYVVWANGQIVACAAFASAVRHLGARDRFIGWDATTRRRNLRLIAYNTRFLILPWVQAPHLASHLLSRLARRIAPDWQRLYAHPVVILETFVDGERFRGTCYRAANWIAVGQTTGRGKNDSTNQANRSLKDVLVYPLVRRFRERLHA